MLLFGHNRVNFKTIALLSFENLPCSAPKITYKHFHNTN